MNLRTAAVSVVAMCALGLPAAAVAASPLQDPPPKTSPTPDADQEAVDPPMQAYRLAPVQQRRGIHNDIVLLINTGRSARSRAPTRPTLSRPTPAPTKPWTNPGNGKWFAATTHLNLR
jgi:hypothetical protein